MNDWNSKCFKIRYYIQHCLSYVVLRVNCGHILPTAIYKIINLKSDLFLALYLKKKSPTIPSFDIKFEYSHLSHSKTNLKALEPLCAINIVVI